MRGALVFFCSILVLTGCTRESPVPSAEIYRARNAGRLHAARGTQEGYEEAVKLFGEVLEQRFDAGDLLNLGRCLTLAGRLEEARPVLAKARRALSQGYSQDDGLPVDIFYIEGLLEKGSNNYAAAAVSFREVAKRDPALETGWYQLGSVLFLDGAYRESIEAFDEVLVRNPRHVPAHYKRSMAYRSLGDLAKADEGMSRFLELKKQSGQVPTEEAAFEKCRYTQVRLLPPASALADPPRVQLEFIDGTPEGLQAASSDPRGQGTVALLDFDRDGDPDLFLSGSTNRIFRNDSGHFEDITEYSELTDVPVSTGAQPADFTNDSIVDLLVYGDRSTVLLKGLGEGIFQPLPGAGLELAGQTVEHASWVDYDHDGDLDLVTLAELVPAKDTEVRSRGQGAWSVHRNNGDETFTLQPGFLPENERFAARGSSITACDLDRGNDIDFVIASPSGPAQAFFNLRAGPFRRVPILGLAGHGKIAAGDLNGDGEFDLVGAPLGKTPLRVALGGRPGGPGELPTYTLEEPLTAAPATEGGGTEASDWGVTNCMSLLDLDNDGDLDLLLGTSRGLVYLANRGGRLALDPLQGIASERPGNVVAVRAVDVEGDGKLSLFVSSGDGRVTLWRNVSKLSYPAVTLRPIGSRDNRDGVGTHVELFAGVRYQRRIVEPIGYSGGVGGVRFGLGSTSVDALDGFEILWPNGIAQAVLGEALGWDARRAMDVTQKRGLAVSCPFLYVNDGNGYSFLTDVVGVAPLDEWLPPGTVPHLDPEEHVRIPGQRLRPSDGALEVVITEELRETTYLDRLLLIRVTHPAGTVVYTDESTRQGAREPLRVWVARTSEVRPAKRVVDDKGTVWTREAKVEDRTYLHPYGEAPSQWAGWTPSHAVDIEPPENDAPAQALLLAGRIYWPDSSVMFALDQHGRGWAPPRLDAIDQRGEARTVCDDIGFPCGMDRTIVLPLGREDMANARALRLVTNHRFLWDRIAFARRMASAVLEEDGILTLELGGSDRVSLRRDTLPLASAVLGYRGFSSVVGDQETHEQIYDFNDAGPLEKFSLPSGYATRYGEALSLVSEADSRLVVLAPGDALWIKFDAGPALREKLEEVTYFLKVTGWAKESNFHNSTGRRIEPLPFLGMKAYPAVGAGPVGHAEYVGKYQTRRVDR
jgi:tetratricopeptide (TPR) repeat protein